ncbi:HAMP domain-containing sensor histidine kinase [Acidovorax sp. M2(2025)]|uniref:sensor histidine kinase n=1 Tax=Acidovorax sp. M2(2025) TaxID=3411355 RepID=UPI003BF4D8AE
MKRFNSLGAKVALAYLAGMALSIGLLFLAAMGLLQGNVLPRIDLRDTAEDMAAMVRFDAEGRPAALDPGEDQLAWVFESLRAQAAYRVLDDAGKVALLSPAGASFWPASGEALRLSRGRFEFDQGGQAVLGATEPIQRGERVWYLQVAAHARLMKLLRRVALPVAGAGVFSLVLLVTFGLCAYFTLRYTLAPLRAVSESAAAISPRSLHARLQTEGVPAEIAPLVESFNRALERLEQGYRMQQEFLGHAAHELKTPLALIRAQIELDGPGDASSLLEDVEYMTRQVQQLLMLAEASEARNYRFAPTGIAQVARDALAWLQRMAEAADVRLVLEDHGTGGVEWNADRSALFTLLKNLLENAIQHAPPGSTVAVEVQRHCFCVRDGGPGVDAEHLPRLFERFWRAAHRRDKGAGLGLSICQEIAVAHGWQISAEPASPGLRFRVAGPAAAPCARPSPQEAHP